MAKKWEWDKKIRATLRAKKLDIKEMRIELIEIYEGFLKNPNNPVIQKEAYKMYTNYMNAGSLLKEPISTSIDFLSEMIQYMDGTFNREEIRQSAKKILQRLKEK